MAHPHLSLNPVIISLSELPIEGRTFQYSHTSGELTPTLKDVVENQPYEVTIHIQPAGNVFQATGTIKTGLNEICSLCAIDFVLPVNDKFHEILVIQPPPERTGIQARVNHSHELNTEGPDYTELETEQFHVGEYVRERIALARPMKPMGKPNCDQSCENYQEAVRKGWLTPYKEDEFKPESPFAQLAKVKLNS